MYTTLFITNNYKTKWNEYLLNLTIYITKSLYEKMKWIFIKSNNMYNQIVKVIQPNLYMTKLNEYLLNLIICTIKL
jgi:hypothetical protein